MTLSGRRTCTASSWTTSRARLSPSPKLNKPSQRLSQTAKRPRQPPAMAETGRANLACAVHDAMEKRLALNDAMRNILFEIEMMTVHHLVKHEEELVILNHAQKELVRSLHAAQAAFFWMQAQGTSRRVLTMSASASSRAPGQTQSALRTGQGVRGVRAWPGRSHPRQRRGSPRRGPVCPRSQVRAMGFRLRRGILRSGHQVSPRSQTQNKTNTARKR